VAASIKPNFFKKRKGSIGVHEFIAAITLDNDEMSSTKLYLNIIEPFRISI
jgi:hypothetical protein